MTDKRPVTHEREAAIRKGERGPLPDVFDVGRRTRDDLLALLDLERARALEAEAWCARLANDREYESALIGVGVAKALQVLREHQQSILDAPRMPDHSARLDSAARLERLIKDACGPASLPPHERTLARLRRLEEAMAQIAARLSANKTAGELMTDARWAARLARAALEGSP